MPIPVFYSISAISVGAFFVSLSAGSKLLKVVLLGPTTMRSLLLIVLLPLCLVVYVIKSQDEISASEAAGLMQVAAQGLSGELHWRKQLAQR